MLSVEGVSVRFGATSAVDDVTLHVPAGVVTAVLGPSGCGKSSLLRAVAGLEPLAAGRVTFAGEDLAGVPTHRRGFAMMFQDGQLFAHLDVAGNVAYALARKGIRGPAARAEVDRLLALVGLDGYAARRPATLSGGEAQRVALARALAARPRLLLLDEPLSALDRSLRERLAVDRRRVLTETGTTALLVTHDHDEAFAVADRTAIMRAGRLVQEGPTAQVWAHPVDAETARFLGYVTVLHGDAAARVCRALTLCAASPGAGAAASSAARSTEAAAAAGPVVALRRDAMLLNPDGTFQAVVTGARSGGDGTRVLLDVEGIGESSARLDSGAAPEVGVTVRVSPRPAAVALLTTPG